jgi:hypothetical protein
VHVSAHLGVAALGEGLVLAGELGGDGVALGGAAALDEGLDDAAGVVLHDEVLDVPAHDGHELADVRLALGGGHVRAPRLRPHALGVGEQRRVRLGGAPLREQLALGLVRFARRWGEISK